MDNKYYVEFGPHEFHSVLEEVDSALKWEKNTLEPRHLEGLRGALRALMAADANHKCVDEGYALKGSNFVMPEK